MSDKLPQIFENAPQESIGMKMILVSRKCSIASLVLLFVSPVFVFLALIIRPIGLLFGITIICSILLAVTGLVVGILGRKKLEGIEKMRANLHLQCCVCLLYGLPILVNLIIIIHR